MASFFNHTAARTSRAGSDNFLPSSTSVRRNVFICALRRARRFVFFFAVLLIAFYAWTENSFAAGINSKRMAQQQSTTALQVGAYEGRTITAVEVVIEGSAPDPAAVSEFASLLSVAPNTEYAAVRVRDSLEALFKSGRVANARIEVFEANATGSATPRTAGAAAGPIRVRFIVRRQVRVGEVLLDLSGTNAGTTLSADEIRARLNMLEPGANVTEQTLRRNADEIQVYLRDRGFFRATVESSQQLDASGIRAVVTFRINAGEQSRVAAFNINVTGFDPQLIRPTLALQPNAPFSRTALGEDINRIRQAIIALGYLAPQLNDADVRLDSAGNLITITLTGAVGPKISVSLQNYTLSKKKERELLPVTREGNVDQSAIEEGRRRLLNRLQEQGYFFADVTPACTITPPLPVVAAAVTAPPGDIVAENNTCENLNPQELSNRNLQITYDVERGRLFKLTDIRIEGTNKLSYADVENDLKTQKANALGFIPFFGYGRGFTSRELLETDKRTIAARMADLGYRKATVDVRQGVSINGESLIITFVVAENTLTRVASVEVRGNQIYTDERLRDELTSETCHADDDTRGPIVVGAPFSRTRARADGNCLLNLYARNGYVDAQVDFSIVELPRKSGDEQVRLVYTVKREGDKVFVNRILINGNVKTKRESILQQLPIVEGDVLRADKLTEGERNLYNTDAFRQVLVRTEPSGETSAGFRKYDIIIDVEEKKPRLLQYGGGYSTDKGPEGLFDLTNLNASGKLRQTALRVRAGQRQQLARLEYLDPRFRQYGNRQFAPLNLSAQYQRDSTITRFFRTTIDQGNFGVVQRLNEKGKPIDEFGKVTKEPSLNRFTINLETQRDLEMVLSPRGKVLKRTTVLARYNYEDVRLYNIESLLISDILRPDRKIRLSRFATTLVRDTRDDPLDATRGDFLTFDYAIALRQLGGNLSFNKLLTTYRRYYKFEGLRGTVLAGSATLGLANILSPRDRDGNQVIDERDRQLPISERFFSGGSTTLRGFGFEEAGPRFVVPGGVFRNNKGKPVNLNPFTVPIGGNAEAIINLEARVPITKDFGVVPFYDGGNVFRTASELFGRKPIAPANASLADLRSFFNARQNFTHTVGLGFRIKTPVGGSVSIDYGYLLNPPRFLIPQTNAPDAIFRPKPSHIHFRFTQTF